MTILVPERPAPAGERQTSLAATRAERFSALFGKHPDAVVVRREMAGRSPHCVLDFCAARRTPPLAAWRDDAAIEVALAAAEYDAYLSLMAELTSREYDWAFMQTIYWKDVDRLLGWCWMQIPAYSA